MSWKFWRKPELVVKFDWPVTDHAALEPGDYDPALAAPVPEPPSDAPQAGIYTIVYSNGVDRREVSLWAETPQFARQLSDAHEAEYCALTGAELYPFDRIDYPESE